MGIIDDCICFAREFALESAAVEQPPVSRFRFPVSGFPFSS
jgi:hypothetical protein